MPQRPAEGSKGGRPRTLAQPAKTTLYLPADLRTRIDAARNGTPLAEWIRQATEQRLRRVTSMHTFTLQAHQSSGDIFLLEYDGEDRIVAACPNVNMSREELRGVLADIEANDVPTLDAEFYDNAEWARAQRWGYPLTAEDLQD